MSWIFSYYLCIYYISKSSTKKRVWRAINKVKWWVIEMINILKCLFFGFECFTNISNSYIIVYMQSFVLAGTQTFWHFYFGRFCIRQKVVWQYHCLKCLISFYNTISLSILSSKLSDQHQNTYVRIFWYKTKKLNKYVW